MKHFINEYSYTDDVLEESVHSWWCWKLKKHKILFLTMLFLFLCLFIVSGQFMFLLPAIISAIGLFLYKCKIANGIKVEKERVRVLNPDSVPLFHIEMSDSRLTISNLDKSRTIDLIGNLEGFRETKNQVVLFIKGMMTVTFVKSGFKEGTSEELTEYLKSLK